MSLACSNIPPVVQTLSLPGCRTSDAHRLLWIIINPETIMEKLAKIMLRLGRIGRHGGNTADPSRNGSKTSLLGKLNRIMNALLLRNDLSEAKEER